MTGLTIQRVYGGDFPDGSRRVLVDRVWPRGVTKASLGLELWAKEVAPSPALRKWFNHDPARWLEFRRRYRAELRHGPARESLKQLEQLASHGSLVLLYGAKDTEHNQAVVLLERLGELVGKEH
ncbi:MAG: DUF488 domain-containing protein [Candidatus Dormibacteria bacterium]